MARLLSEMKVGEKGTVERVDRSGRACRRITEMGIVPGTALKIQRVAPLGDPIWVRVKGYQLSLRKEEAAKVYVGND
jgi:Fe2+ transport system protein FeoA